MADRYYDRILKCGCMISTDGGGGLLPCCYPGYGATEEDIKKCNEAWAEWKKTADYQEHLREIKRKNQ